MSQNAARISAASEPTAKELARKQVKTHKTLASKEQLVYDDGPKEWWKRYSTTLPELALLVRSFLAVQATSVASERLLSTTWLIVSNFRTGLKPENIRMLTFLATKKLPVLLTAVRSCLDCDV